MVRIIGINAASPGEQWPDLHTGAHIHAAGPLWSQQTLMSGKAQHIDPQLLYIDLPHAGGLRCIHDKQKTVPLCDRMHPFQIDHISGQIGGVGTDDHLRLRTYGPLHLLIGNVPFLITPEDRQGCSPFPALIQRPEHGIVLQYGCDHMVSGIAQPFYGDIQALCRVCRKHDPGRRFRMEQSCQLLPCPVYDTRCIQGRIRRPASCVPHRIERRKHRFFYLHGLAQCSRGIVHIDHTFHLRPSGIQNHYPI